MYDFFLTRIISNARIILVPTVEIQVSIAYLQLKFDEIKTIIQLKHWYF